MKEVPSKFVSKEVSVTFSEPSQEQKEQTPVYLIQARMRERFGAEEGGSMVVETTVVIPTTLSEEKELKKDILKKLKGIEQSEKYI